MSNNLYVQYDTNTIMDPANRLTIIVFRSLVAGQVLLRVYLSVGRVEAPSLYLPDSLPFNF